MRHPISLAFCCAVLFVLQGCGGSAGSTPPPQIFVTVSPSTATVIAGGTQQFTAGVTGTTNTGVTWSVAGGPSDGTVTTSGLYTAPASVPNPATVTVTATSLADSSKFATATVTVQFALQVLPSAVTLQVNGTQQFSANVSGTTNPPVTWTVLGGVANGTITPSGFYTAPAAVPNPAQVTVQATSVADATQSGTATVTVIAPLPSVTVNPNPATVGAFATQQFSASVSNLSSTAVTWQVNGVAGGSKQYGFISSAGLYVAPGAVPTKSNGQGDSVTTTVLITAVSQVNSSASGSSTVTVFPTNQSLQGGTIALGTSGGNEKDLQTSGGVTTCCSGTLGSLVTRGGTQYLLSNNHVLARTDQALAGENIIQPGLIDVNCGQGANNVVGTLTQFYNLETGPSPKIDAAIAQVAQNAVDSTGNILYLGATTDANNVPVPGAPTAGAGLPETGSLLSRAVAKSGRTTGLTCSTIFSVSTATSVQYQKGCASGATFSETFDNQVAVTGGAFSAPGDSGSLIVTQDTAEAVALLFGGSDQESVGNPVGAVLNYFQSGSNAVTFVGGATHAVIGCSLPTAPASATLRVPLNAIAKEAMQRAIAVRDANAPALMSHTEVQAVGVGASLDNPGEAAIVLFVAQGQPRTGIPAAVEGIRTRIVEGELFAERGVLSAEQSAALEQASAATLSVYPISEAEFARAKAVHQSHVDEWMSKTGVQGVGIGSSVDSPGEAALVLFVIRGVAHEAIPPVIDGLRTRVRESSRFRAGLDDGNSRGSCSAGVASAKTPNSATVPSRKKQLPPPGLRTKGNGVQHVASARSS
jgi:hypothetical protein